MKQGMIHGLSFAEYQAIPALNWSLLKEILHSPGKLAWRKANPWEPSDVATKGSAIDALVTEPDVFAREFTTAPLRQEELPDHFKPVPPEFIGKNNAMLKAGKDWLADQPPGMVPVKPSDWNGYGLNTRSDAYKAWKRHVQEQGMRVLSHCDLSDVRGAARAVTSYPLAREILDSGEMQVAAVWQDEGSGVWCKCRIDIYHPGVVTDLKSTGTEVSLDMGGFAFKSGWHRQMGFYCDGAEVATGEPHDRARIIAVEQSPPHRVEVFEMSASMLEQGRAETRDALRAYAHCQRRGEWPTSSGRVQTMTLPAWAMK